MIFTCNKRFYIKKTRFSGRLIFMSLRKMSYGNITRHITKILQCVWSNKKRLRYNLSSWNILSMILCHLKYRNKYFNNDTQDIKKLLLSSSTCVYITLYIFFLLLKIISLLQSFNIFASKEYLKAINIFNVWLFKRHHIRML